MALQDKLDYITSNKSLNSESSRSLEKSTTHIKFSGRIFRKVIPINKIFRIFGYLELELAIQIFFHDIMFSGTGHHHRVNRRNLPRLSNPNVSIVYIKNSS